MPSKSAEQLAEQLAAISSNCLPPIELWDPPYTGEIDIHITKDGVWRYLGDPIQRSQLVRLFAGVLKREADGFYYLVTPIEKLRIKVDDAPFVITLAERYVGEGKSNGFSIILETNLRDKFVMDGSHQLSVVVNSNTSEPSPYVIVRKNLPGLISRNVFYQLVEWAHEKVVDGKNCLVIESAGEFFNLGQI